MASLAVSGCCYSRAVPPGGQSGQTGVPGPEGEPFVVVWPESRDGTCDEPAPIARHILSSANGTASFQPLGGLSGPRTDSTAVGVSVGGSVVVGHSRGHGDRDRPTTWTSEGMTTLPIPDLNGEDSAWIHAVSANAAVAVGEATATKTSAYAVMWTGCDELTMLGRPPGGVSAAARSVSGDGRVVIGFGLANGGCASGSCYGSFRWEDGRMVRLLDQDGGPLMGQAKDVSGDGRIIVGWGTERNEAFRMEGDGLSWLGFSPGAKDSRAEAVSADGSVIVGTSGEAAFRLEGGRMERLNGPSELPRSYAYDVSSYGCRIVGNMLSPPPPKPTRDKKGRLVQPPHPPVRVHAFVWERKRGMRRIDDVMRADHGIDMTGWILDEAFGISADGTTIVGDGENPDGHQEGWVVRLPAPTDCQTR